MALLPAGFALPSEIIRDGELFHMAMAVPDIERTMASMGQALSLDWTAVRDIDMRIETATGVQVTPIKAVYSLQGPPYVEIISGPAGSFFSAADGPRLHHAGLIVEDWEGEVARLGRLDGLKLHGTAGIVAMFTTDFGFNLEVMSQSARGVLDAWLAPNGR